MATITATVDPEQLRRAQGLVRRQQDEVTIRARVARERLGQAYHYGWDKRAGNASGDLARAEADGGAWALVSRLLRQIEDQQREEAQA